MPKRSGRSRPSSGGAPQGAPAQMVADLMLDAVITVDETGIVRGWSAQAERLLGWPQGDIVGRGMGETFMAPAAAELHDLACTELLHHSAAPGLMAREDVMVVRRDGVIIPVEMCLTRVALGSLALYCMFLRDLTERRKSERVRRIVEEMVDSSSDAMITKTLDGVVTSWNPGAERLYGYTAAEAIGQSIDLVLPAEERAQEVAARARMQREEQVPPYEAVRTRKDGSTFDAFVTLSAVRNRYGEIVGAATIARDITPIRRLREELEGAQARLRNALTSSPAMVYAMRIVGEDFHAVWISENVTRLFGYSPDEAVQPGWWGGAVHPEDRTMVGREIAVLRSTGSYVVEYRFRHKDGNYRWVLDDARLLRGREGQPDEIYGAWLDITEHKLLGDRLGQSQRLEATGRLAAGIAHDFNNLLTVIIGHVELLLGGGTRPEAEREDLIQIRDGAAKAAELTQQLLAFSRQQVLQPRRLDLNAVVRKTERLIRRVVSADIELTVALADAPLPVNADPGQLEQVILNLVINARDAMPDGGRLVIETGLAHVEESLALHGLELQPGPMVMLAVTDTGVGMNEETRAKVFEPFFTTKAETKGTGLGLATVYGIIKQSNGFVWVYSELGKGACFKVYLPQAHGAAPVAAEAPAPATVGGVETILLVEDTDAVRRVTRLSLERLGYTVLEAADPQEAQRLASTLRDPIHLLLTDVIMPGINGRMLANRLRETHPDLKVLFMSGYTDDVVVRHGAMGPGSAFLQKPFGPIELARKVRELLEAPAR